MRFDSPSNFGPAHYSTITRGDKAAPVVSDTDDVFDADPADFAPPAPARPGQIKFVTDLRAQYDEAKAQHALMTGQPFVPTAWGELPTTADAASEAIDKGKAAVAAMRKARDEAVAGGGFFTDGQAYWLVQVGRESGYPYAKVWNEESRSFFFDRSAMRDVWARGRRATLAEAEAFGVRFGICGECGRTLTNPDSIERGIGPICAGKF